MLALYRALYKADRLLYFTARALALAGWAELEALNEFYESMLEEFWLSPADCFANPTVEDLKRCETAAWKQVARLIQSTKCSVESALQSTVWNLVEPT